MKIFNKILPLFFPLYCFLFTANPVFCQYIPKDSAQLNYNQIMFEFPFNESAKYYTIYITYDSILNPKKGDFIVKQKELLPISLVKNLTPNTSYKWYVETTLDNGKRILSDYYHFSILKSRQMNPKRFKSSQVYNKKNKILDGIIWCDQYRCAVDRNGKIVWFMSEPQNKAFATKLVRDFKTYSDGSITFINQPDANHVDIDMNIIWKAPSTGTISGAKLEDYHHDMEILSNGNYMILGNEKVNFTNDSVKSEAIDFSNIIEFDTSGKIVWYWRMKDHFPYELLVNSNIETKNGIVNPHANSFCVDDKENVIYLNYRDISRIIKIDKNSKKIIASYGTKLADEDTLFETDLFKRQHDIQFIGNNDFLMFNNNDVSKEKISSVEIIHFPVNKSDSFYSKWKFELNYDKYSDGKVEKMGGVKILPNGNFLISEGSSNRVVEISPNKEILWDFKLEQIDSVGDVNEKFAIYRTNFSTSLYPNYFSFYKLKNGEIKLINMGDETDSYFVSVTNKSNIIIYSSEIKEVKPKDTYNLKLPIDTFENISIQIKSKNSKITKTK